VRDTETLPDLPKDRYCLAIATEILEHVRDPLAVLRRMTESLTARGLLFSSMGLGFEREAGGDHLSEAIRLGQTAAYRAYLKANYALSADRGDRPWLFRRTW